ncbi:protein phosphatase [Alkalithermobacter thermoalcaliphilus JW-YL-7 = DSM 7308]|uniref:Protein phosphatase n=1 Tax=Alkalithermobacter thermoalcaliphilus JW-YL-7 = DSM 7308 TaxID=1121328 RepID=A0A150FPQ6_CLOPD|nr:protein serine/threonine phosphatase [[Clostridium] paradoxum JW-YL-7 = DSM 7308]SHK96304.1 protein phosphatase [[Clostridium] paradoxum JW-YL-7 = DSM 7308]
MKHYALSDIGKVRKLNEDYFGFDKIKIKDKHIHVYTVADGMGGHNKGEVASKLAVETLLDYIRKNIAYIDNLDNKSITNLLKKSYEFVNKLIYNLSIEDEKFSGMGTTLTTCVIYEKTMYTANVGDSRCYLYNDNKLTQITKDHSLVQELIEKRLIDEEKARTHPQRHIITRAIGTDKFVELDIYINHVKENSKILLTTDGLTNYVSDKQIVSNISDDIEKCCFKLVELANQNGGRDNITIICISI